MKGLTEARRQLLATYPSKEDITEEEWSKEVQHWAAGAYAKLSSLGPLSEQFKRKAPPPGVRSLSEKELDQLKQLCLKCTDLRQLKDVQQLFFIHLRSLVAKFRPGRR